MSDSDLKSLGVSQAEVKAALAREHRSGARRRLVAVGKMLDGKSMKQAAHAAKATRGSVERWLKQVRQSGVGALLLDRPGRYQKRKMTPIQAEETRHRIATALQRRLEPQVRIRLVTIDMVLSGQPIKVAAAFAFMRQQTVEAWLRLVIHDGLIPTLARWEGKGKHQLRPRQLNADPAALRALAAKERNPRIQKRMLALACVAEGMNPHAASMRTGLDHKAIAARIRRFQKEPTATFQDRQPFGRPKKLSAAQAQELRLAILEHPAMTYEQLADVVKARFGVCYSFRGLRLLLKRELGIARKGRRFREAGASQV